MFREALTFDDVLLEPAESNILPSQADTTTQVSRTITLGIPLLSAAMDTVTESAMAIAMAQAGGIGVLHRNMTPAEQAAEVIKVKKFESGMVVNPLTILPTAKLAEALALMTENNISGVPVTEADGKLVGILTNRDVRFATNPNQAVSELMTKENLITVKEEVAHEEAKKLLHQNRIEKLLVVDGDYKCIGLITVKDMEKAQLHPNAAKDEKGRLRVAAASTVGDDGFERSQALIDAGVDLIVVDTAHGHSVRVAEQVARLKKLSSSVQIMAGNVATKDGAQSLIDAGNALSLAALDWSRLSESRPYLKTFALGVGPRRLGRSPSMYRWLREQCAVGNVDVLHNHGMWQMNSVYPAWVTKQTGVPLVYSPHGAFSAWAMLHGSVVKKMFWPLLQAPALKHATCFHATAFSEYEEIRALGFRQPVMILPNGIDVAPCFDDDVCHSSSKRTLLFLSRLHPKKGLEVLLQAWQVLQNLFPDWRLMIVGSDDGYHASTGYLKHLQQMSKSLALRDVEFAGALHGRDKYSAYRESELLVLPTYSENFGMVVAEALAHGVPAVVSKGAPWSGLEANGAGWWIDVGVTPLIQCLHDALSLSPEDLTVMGRRGREWMQHDFSWPIIGAKMAETYRWLCDRSLPIPPWVRLD